MVVFIFERSVSAEQQKGTREQSPGAKKVDLYTEHYFSCRAQVKTKESKTRKTNKNKRILKQEHV